jgi:hypothetical protein
MYIIKLWVEAAVTLGIRILECDPMQFNVCAASISTVEVSTLKIEAAGSSKT